MTNEPTTTTHTEDALRAFWNDPERVAKWTAKLEEMERQLDKKEGRR